MRVLVACEYSGIVRDAFIAREQRIWKMPPSPDRGKERARTYQGIADAMADQWGHP
jgi:hypothetical protein